MLTQALLLAASLLVSTMVNAQVFSRELGDFDLKLATQPSRSMAQGLVKPTSSGSTFHGGLDLSHDSGWYAGQWAPTMGIKPGSNLEVDSYLGYKHPFDQTLSYELGMIHYSYPKLNELDSQQIFAGLTILEYPFWRSLQQRSGPARQHTVCRPGRQPALWHRCQHEIHHPPAGYPSVHRRRRQRARLQ